MFAQPASGSGQPVRAPVLVQHPYGGQPVYGIPLRPGESLFPTDVYSRMDGVWQAYGTSGVVPRIAGVTTVYVRPVVQPG